MALSKRQAYAILHPVAAGKGPRLKHRLRIDHRFWTELVVDDDRDCWRASIGLLNSMGGLQPPAGWPSDSMEKARAIALRLLRGVGDGDPVLDTRGLHVVAEVALSPSERAAYGEIPAEGDGG